MYKSYLILTGLFLVIILVWIFGLNKSSDDSDYASSKTLERHLFEQKKANKYKFKTDKPDLAMQEEIALRSEIGKGFSYRPNYRFKALETAQKLRRHSLHKTSALDWVERGPGNVGGRTRSIAVHPEDENTWLVAAVGGGIWKTADAGQTWRSVTDNLPVLSATTIAICTSAPSVVYAGTGEGFYNSDAVIGDGVFKSVDEGETWQQLISTASNSNFRYVNRIIVSPGNPDLVLAATNSGLYRSENGGNTWTEVFNRGLRVQQIISNPLNFNTQFIAVDGRGDSQSYDGGIYKSTDAGQTWRYVSEEIVNHYRIEMAIAEVDTNILYASPVNSDYGLLGFFRSPDAGESWTDYGNSTNWLGGQGWYDNALVVSPLDPDVVFVGGIDIYRVRISGSSMTTDKMTHWYSGAGYPYVHADQHYFVTLQDGPTNFAIIAANDGGIHYSADRGQSWTELNNNYNVTQYYDADKHPFQLQFIGGTQDNGTHRSPVDPDYTSSWPRVLGGDGFDCAWDKEDDTTVYGTLYYTRVYRSNDGGNNFSQLTNGLPESNIFHTPLAMDPSNSSRLFTAGNNNSFYWTDNSGDQWNEVYANFNDYRRVKIAVSESNPDIVWTGSTSMYSNVSTDGGLTFSQIPDMVGDTHAYLTGLHTHPTQDSTAFLTLGVSGSGKVYRTRDLGQTWENITNNLPDIPVHTVLVMPFDINEIWLGTDIGLFVSFDEGDSWEYADNGIPAVAIRRLKIIGNEIVAATHGRGIWSVYREEITTPLLSAILDDLNVPDPNSGVFKIRFSTRSFYDSAWVHINGEPVDRLLSLESGIDTFGVYQTNPPEDITAQIYSYLNGQVEMSEQKSRSVYLAQAEVTEDFNGQESSFFGDLIIGSESGFDTPLLNSPHPYADATTYLAYMGIPVTISDGTVISYRDVALIEPGEEGVYYPDEEMWDYVTVEGSNDGDNWDLLIDPYDARLYNTWEQAYTNEQDGDESMMQYHDIDLTSFYQLDENVYVRFKLYADAYTTGWGWAIDDVEASNAVSGIASESGTLTRFELYDNYPNPFNPRTNIRFSLDKAQPVSLSIYNSLGQKIVDLVDQEVYQPGVIHNLSWNGTDASGFSVASGFYYYELRGSDYRQIKRMLMLK